MKKIIINLVLIFLFMISLVYAHGEEDFNKAEEIIKNDISCNQLTEEQLELMGDYYMEQMHPGEAHEAMDEMMGGEGSESLKQMHINMARSFYCGEHNAMSSGMMNIMMGRGMMDSSNLGNKELIGGKKMAYGMMDSTGIVGIGLFKVVYFTIAVFVFSAIFWLTHNWLVKDHKKRK